MSDIAPTDRPVSLVIDQSTNPTSYVIMDVHGQVRKRFEDQTTAQKTVDEINTQLMQTDAHDTGVEPVKEQVQPKETPMPAKKKRAKKRVVEETKKAVKKAAKKVAKKVTKRRKKRK